MKANCPKCKLSIVINDSEVSNLIGSSIKCPHCGAAIRVNVRRQKANTTERVINVPRDHNEWPRRTEAAYPPEKRRQSHAMVTVKTGIFRVLRVLMLGLAGGFAAIILFSILQNINPRLTTSKTPKELRKQRIEKQFSPWDGSHIQLTKLIKQHMNDPDSFKHDSTSYWDMGDHLVVITHFRGRNAYGGMVRHWVKAKVDLDGKVLQIIEQGP